jgi:hypothetical protein
MDRIKIVDEINQHRRRLFGAAAMAVAATQLGMIGSATAQRAETKVPAVKPGTNTSFGALKQVNAGVLNVGYAEAGPANGPAPGTTNTGASFRSSSGFSAGKRDRAARPHFPFPLGEIQRVRHAGFGDWPARP